MLAGPLSLTIISGSLGTLSEQATSEAGDISQVKEMRSLSNFEGHGAGRSLKISEIQQEGVSHVLDLMHHSHSLPFSLCIKYSTSTTFVSGIT